MDNKELAYKTQEDSFLLYFERCKLLDNKIKTILISNTIILATFYHNVLIASSTIFSIFFALLAFKTLSILFLNNFSQEDLKNPNLIDDVIEEQNKAILENDKMLVFRHAMLDFSLVFTLISCILIIFFQLGN